MPGSKRNKRKKRRQMSTQPAQLEHTNSASESASVKCNPVQEGKNGTDTHSGESTQLSHPSTSGTVKSPIPSQRNCDSHCPHTTTDSLTSLPQSAVAGPLDAEAQVTTLQHAKTKPVCPVVEQPRFDRPTEVSHGNIKGPSVSSPLEHDRGTSLPAIKEKQEWHDTELNQATVSWSSGEMLEILKKDKAGFSQGTLNSALLAMCRQGDKFVVQELVRAGADVDVTSDDGWTPLLMAVVRGYTDIVHFLLHKGANFNFLNPEGDSALILSVRPAGTLDMTKLLLQQEGINLKHKNHKGYTALLKAVEVRDVDTMKILTDEEKRRLRSRKYEEMYNFKLPKFLFSTDPEVISLPRLAAKAGMSNVLKYLQSETDECTAPMEAALARDVDTLRIFMDCQFCNIFKEKRHRYTSFLQMFLEEQKRRSIVLSDADIPVIELLLDNGVPIDAEDSYYADPPLMTAIESDSLGVVHLLCKSGAKMDVTSRGGYLSPVEAAAKKGNVDIINLLVKFGASVTKLNYMGRMVYDSSPLDICLRNGHIQCAKVLLNHGAVMDVKQAVCSAIDSKGGPYMKFLVSEYAAPIKKLLHENPGEGANILTKAVNEDNAEIVNMLLDVGCKYGVENSREEIRSAEMIHRHFNSGFVVGLVDTTYGVKNPLEEARSAEMIRLLLKRGFDINQKTSGEISALRYHIDSYRHEETVRHEIVTVLLENGANVNESDRRGQTLLMKAAQTERSLNILKELVRHGADIHAKDDCGNSALLLAIEGRCVENAKLLIEFSSEQKTDFNVQNESGSNALMAAIKNHYVEIIDSLLECGVHVNIQDSDGNTPLTLAARHKQNGPDILKKLIVAGAYVNHQNNAGFSALMLAAKNSEKDSLGVLLDAGANVNAVNHEQDKVTALSLSVPDPHFRGSPSCMEYLLERGASASYLKSPVLFKIIGMRWLQIIPKLISSGLGPADVMSSSLFRYGSEIAAFFPIISPFIYALFEKQAKLASYFVESWFLTPSDVRLPSKSSSLRRVVEINLSKECIDVLDEFTSQPMPLLKLSFIEVSAAIGCAPGREGRISKLPLPAVIKERLLFKTKGETLPLELSDSDLLPQAGVSRIVTANENLFLALGLLNSFQASSYDDDNFYVTYSSSSPDYNYSDYGGYYDSDDY